MNYSSACFSVQSKMKLHQSVYYDYIHACTHYGKLALSDLKFDT